AYLDGTNTESEPFEDPLETETHESTPPTLYPILHSIACMVVRVPPAMSPGLSANMARVEAMSESAFLEDDEEEEEDEEEDEETEERLDFDSVSEDADDEDPTTKDEDPATGYKGLAAGDKGPGMGVESRSSDDETHGLDDEGHSIESDGLGLGEEEEAVLEGQQRAVLVVGATGGLIRDHTIRLEELSPALFKRYNRDKGELFTRSGAVRDEIFTQRYQFRSLEHEQERVTVTFGALWRPVLALESWAGQTDAHRAALWHVISDTQGENQEL
ncbi:hypothetical protein Tco_0718373, partial [Tanacetum coccineum]